jgi:hypothetical protein
MSLEAMLATARSVRPLPVKSAATMEYGDAPVVFRAWNCGRKMPSPLPSNTLTPIS